MKLWKDRKEFLTILFLFGLVLFIRVVYIPTGKVWYDEVVSILTAKSGVEEIYQISLVDTNTPVYFILLHYYLQMFGESEVGLRFFSVIFSILSSVFIFLIVKELTDNKLLPKIALFLVAVSPFHLYYSHEIRAYSLLIFLSSVTLLSIIKCVNNKEPKAFWCVCYSVSLILGAYLHITYLFYILALNVFVVVELFRERRRDLFLRNLLLPNSLLVGSIVVFHVMGYSTITEQIANVIKVKSAASGNSMYGTSMADFLSTIVCVYWGKTISPSILVATATLLYLGLKKMRAEGRYALLFVTILATSVCIPPHLPPCGRYMAYALPTVVVLLTLGTHHIWKVLNEFGGPSFKPSRVLVVYAVIVAVILSIRTSVRCNGYSRLASFFEENRLSEAVILVVPSWERYTLLYYLSGSIPVKGVNTNLDKLGLGLSLAENLSANWQPVVDERTVVNLENYIRGFRNVWYINSDQSSDPENWALRWLVENTHLEKIYYVDCSEQVKSPTMRMPVLLFRNEGI